MKLLILFSLLISEFSLAAIAARKDYSDLLRSNSCAPIKKAGASQVQVDYQCSTDSKPLKVVRSKQGANQVQAAAQEVPEKNIRN